MQMREAGVDELSPNPWNTNHITDPLNEQRLRKSIDELGMFRPIVVRQLGDGTLEILGGEHRWRAAKQMGMRSVPIVDLGPVDDDRAKRIGLVDNARYGDDDMSELSALVQELDLGELLDVMPFSQAEIDAFGKVPDLIDLDDLDSKGHAALPDPSKPPAAPTTQLIRFKVPVEDTTWITALVDRRMKEMAFKDEDALTNAGNALVSLLQELRK